MLKLLTTTTATLTHEPNRRPNRTTEQNYFVAYKSNLTQLSEREYFCLDSLFASYEQDIPADYDDIAFSAWDWHTLANGGVDNTTLRVLVSRVRKKIRQVSDREHIETIRLGKGSVSPIAYRFNPRGKPLAAGQKS